MSERNSLSFSQKIALVDFLRERPNAIEASYDDLRKEAEEELKIPLTHRNIVSAWEAAGLPPRRTATHQSIKKLVDEDMKILVTATVELYHINGVTVPHDLRRLYQSLGGH